MAGDDELDIETEPAPELRAEIKPKRKRRASTTAPKRTSRFERRAEKAATTIREIIRVKRPDLDVEGKTFEEVVERDAEAWGKFIAQLAEWIVPLGGLIDLIFGSPIAILAGIAPSVRAGRRDFIARRARKKAEREAEREAERLEDEFERVQREGGATE